MVRLVQSPPRTTPASELPAGQASTAVDCTNLTIDGGGTIYGRGADGQTNGGTWFGNAIKEAERPMVVWTVLSDHVTIQNIYVRLSAMWTIVPMETDYLLIKDVLLNVDTVLLTTVSTLSTATTRWCRIAQLLPATTHSFLKPVSVAESMIF